MGISDLYMGIGQKRNISHFANIVRIAKADNVITEEEFAFLHKVAKKFNISKRKFKEIVKDPEKFPTIAYLESIERIERLYDLVKMINADHVIAWEEVTALRKIATGLAFPIKHVDKIVDAAIEFDTDESDLESFHKRMLEILPF